MKTFKKWLTNEVVTLQRQYKYLVPEIAKKAWAYKKQSKRFRTVSRKHLGSFEIKNIKPSKLYPYDVLNVTVSVNDSWGSFSGGTDLNIDLFGSDSYEEMEDVVEHELIHIFEKGAQAKSVEMFLDSAFGKHEIKPWASTIVRVILRDPKLSSLQLHKAVAKAFSLVVKPGQEKPPAAFVKQVEDYIAARKMLEG